jgi:hypothetical protein
MLRKKLRACDKALLLNPNIASEIKRKMKSKAQKKVRDCSKLYLVIIKDDIRLSMIRHDFSFLPSSLADCCNMLPCPSHVFLLFMDFVNIEGLQTS